MENNNESIICYRSGILMIISHLTRADNLAKEAILFARTTKANINIIQFISDTINEGYLDLDKNSWLTKNHISNYYSAIKGLKSSMDNALYNIINSIEDHISERNV